VRQFKWSILHSIHFWKFKGGDVRGITIAPWMCLIWIESKTEATTRHALTKSHTNKTHMKSKRCGWMLELIFLSVDLCSDKLVHFLSYQR